MADRDEHDLKTLEFYFMEVHVAESISREVIVIGVHHMGGSIHKR
jgi:hypothetical protein